MDATGGRTPTGRRVAGACTDLVELRDAEGTRQTALVFHDAWKDDPSLGSPMDAIRGRMARTGVIGLPDLVDVDSKSGSWIYATGTAWSVSEMVRALAEAGETGSIRAGLELCYLAAEVLLEAADIGSGIGVHCHGSLDPLRLLVRNDGQVLVIGWGLPAVDVAHWLEDGRTRLHEDSLRYAPPERFTGAAMDLSADLFALTLCGLELMVGKPVYDGLFDDIAAQARNGDAVRRVFGWRDALPATVQEALVRALKPDPDARYRDGVEYLYAVHDLLSSIDADGPPLVEVVARYRGLTSRDRLAAAKATGAYSPAELAELTADLDEVEAKPLGTPSRPRPDEPEPEPEPVEADETPERWGRVERGDAKERPSRSTSRSDDKQDARAALRSRLKRSAPPTETKTESDNNADARQRLRRRLRERDPTSSEDEHARPRRRGRGRRESEADEAEEVEAVDAPIPEPEPEPEPEAAPEPEPEPEAAPEPEVDVEPSAAASAAALLQRLRGKPLGSTSVPPAPPVVEEDDEDDVTADEADDELPPEEADDSDAIDDDSDEVEVDDDSDEVDDDSDEVDDDSDEVDDDGDDDGDDSDEAGDDSDEAGDESGVTRRAPALRGPAAPSGLVTVASPDGRSVEVPVQLGREGVARRAAARLGLASVDLTGRLVTAWRVDGEIEPGGTVELEAVPNDVGLREFRVPNPESGSDFRFQAPVGAAMRVSDVLAHLRTWLGLPDGPWRLTVDGAPCDPESFVDDLGEGTLVADLGGGAD